MEVWCTHKLLALKVKNAKFHMNQIRERKSRDCPGTGWVAKFCLCVFLGHSLWGAKHINKIPPKIPGQSIGAHWSTPTPVFLISQDETQAIWSEQHSDQNSDHARLCVFLEKEKLRPWSKFLGRETQTMV